MRDLKQCQAEVFRRSKNRIKARRCAYRRILSLCMPLCLGISLLALSILPGLLSQPTGSTSAELCPDGGAGGLTGLLSVEIYQLGIQVQNITEEINADILYSAVTAPFNSIDSEATENTGDNLKNEMSGEATHPKYNSSTNDWMFCFHFHGGQVIKYTLNDNALASLSTQTKVYLSEEQLNTLLELIE